MPSSIISSVKSVVRGFEEDIKNGYKAPLIRLSEKTVSTSNAEHEATRRTETEAKSSRSVSEEVSQMAKSELRLSLIPRSHGPDQSQFTLNKLNLSEIDFYGRETEVSLLHEAFLETLKPNSPSTKLVHIAGFSGTGKSTLALQLRPLVLERNGFYCLGKFAQNNAEPCSAFSNAFSDLIDQITSRDDETVREIREQVRNGIGQQTDALASVVPSPDRLLEDTQYARSSKGLGGKTRRKFGSSRRLSDRLLLRSSLRQPEKNLEGRSGQLKYTLQRFVESIASERHPLVLVLDDMHRADKPSLALMEALLTDVNLSSFLLITTARDNELEDNHPFLSSINSLIEQGVRVKKIEVRNLGQDAVNSITATALRSNEEVTKPLAEVIHKKTLGNAFFVQQFLRTLLEKELLNFNFGIFEWTWEIDKIRALDATDNVGNLMKQSLSSLDPTSQLLLHVAAVLGNRFLPSTLDNIMKKLAQSKHAESNIDVDGLIQDCVHQGLLERGGSTVAFVHDQIQHAALHILPVKCSANLRLPIGQALLAMEDSNQPGIVFLAVDLCNSAFSSLQEDEQRNLAKYNLVAGNEAMEKAAFSTALGYFEAGLLCLGRAVWDTDHDTALSLSNGAAEAAHCSGDDDRLERHIQAVLSRQDILLGEKMPAYLIRLRSLFAKVQHRDCVLTGINLLRKLGFWRKLSLEPSLVRVVLALKRTQRLLKVHDHFTLSTLPLLEDEERLKAMAVMRMIIASAYYVSKQLFVVLSMKMVRWSIKFGICRYSTVAFCAYGMSVGIALKDWQLASVYSKVAMDLSKRLNAQETFAETICVHYTHIHHWTNDLRSGVEPLLYGYQVGMQTGISEWATFCLMQHDRAVFLTGSRSLDLLIPEIEAHLRPLRQQSEASVHLAEKVLLQTCQFLKEESDFPACPSLMFADEGETLRVLSDPDNIVPYSVFKSSKMQLCYLFGLYHEAGILADESAGLGLTLSPSLMFVPRHFFYRGLTALALAQMGKHRRRNLGIAKDMEKRLHKSASGGMSDGVHLSQLLQAEIAVAEGRHETAAELFKVAIRSATLGGFVHEKALAHERAGIFYLDDDNDTYWASYHMKSALESYRCWGAHAKVRHLRESHESLLSE